MHVTSIEEQKRLAALVEMAVLDTPPEPVFDAITALAARVCEVPIALVSLVDADRQWFKSNVGLPGVNETPREVAFCHHAIQQGVLLEVPDAQADPRFRDNPLVRGDPNIRFYAGSPIEVSQGERIGTVCVIDRAPKLLSSTQREVLNGLARIASLAMIDRRRRVGTARALAESEARYRAIVEDQSELISIADPDGTLRFVNAAYAAHFGKAVADLLGRNLLEFVDEADRLEVAEYLARVAQSDAAQTGVNRMQSALGAKRWVSWVNRPLRNDDGKVVAIQSVGRDITEQREAEERLRAALAERETLLKEVYHRVKNNLQVVQSLLSLQHRAVSDPQARRALEDSTRRVRAMALVHEKLYQTGNLNSVPLREYTADLLRQIDEATGAARRGIRFEADVLDLHCKADGAIPFGLVLTELVFNAMEHAFIERTGGQVRIELVMHEQVPMLTVSDNGRSLPDDFNIATVSSMGLQLASTLAQQLGGQLEAGSSQGAWFRTRLPRL